MQTLIERPGAGLLRGTTVLLAEDDDDARELLTFALASCGASVFAAASAHDALRFSDTIVPSVLVTDISMPGEDGFWLLAELRRVMGARGIRIPAVACTALARDYTKDAVLSAGFQGYVTKPVDPLALCTAVADAMRTPLGNPP
jgi:CheY-like chemotaxis protein